MKETATGDELALFRSQVAAFVETEVRPRAEQWEAQGFTPKSLWKRCGELGFLVSYTLSLWRPRCRLSLFDDFL